MLESVPEAALVGAVGLGLLHGAEPGHGWPVAATYALDRSNKWLSGLAASTVLGVGHLISSLAVVGVFFLAKSYAGLGSMWWLDYVAGGLLILLGVREYRHGHSHGHGGADDHSHDNSHDHSHDHSHSHDQHSASLDESHSHDAHSHDEPHSHEHPDDHDADHADDADDDGVLGQLRGALPGGGHSHDPGKLEEAADRGIWSIAATAFVLGFAHEEEFEIIGLCAGSTACLELMTAYALAVVVGIVALTLLLVAGYERYEDRVSSLAEHFPTISAVVLVAMGLGFIAGVL
ncbi:hypothetical protein [Halobacterium zhouii]|uniref:hypothetical protein n=1 Tax=Halobacterium zhouii TaxID=2902624 RepID=UPI001E4337E2|nr:hypothetical protein [Halobacterium zhouii]